MQTIDDATQMFPNNYRVLIDKYYIHAKFKDIHGMQETINTYSQKYSNNKDIHHYNTVRKFKILLYTINGEKDKILPTINELKFYPEETIKKLINKYYISNDEVACSADESFD